MTLFDATTTLPRERFEMLDLENEYLRQKFGLPEQWRWYRFSRAIEDAPNGFMRFTGAVAPVKKDGERNWKKLDKATDRTLFMEIADFRKWRQKRADREGVCVECWGRREVWCGWSVKDGHRYKPCPKCGVIA